MEEILHHLGWLRVEALEIMGYTIYQLVQDIFHPPWLFISGDLGGKLGFGELVEVNVCG
jgi:hypothetical protein